MMKKIFLLLLMAAFIGLSQAQQPASAGNQINKMVIQGYLVRLLPKISGGYGYDIFLRDRMAVHQTTNPFTLSPLGLKTKEEVFKVAKWQIEQIRHRKNIFLVNNQIISKDVAKRLQITAN